MISEADEEPMTPFGARLKELREKKGWSQRMLADRADVQFMTVYRLEREDRHLPRMDVAVKLARTLGVSLDLLCGVYDS
jgi:transcriptional regulator with XRE-family HTH domain